MLLQYISHFPWFPLWGQAPFDIECISSAQFRKYSHTILLGNFLQSLFGSYFVGVDEYAFSAIHHTDLMLLGVHFLMGYGVLLWFLIGNLAGL